MDSRKRRSSGALSIDPASILRAYPPDASLAEGSRNAIATCLGVERGQRHVLVVETEYDAIAAALLGAADELGALTDVHVVDARKAASEPFVATLEARLRDADASLFVGSIDGLPTAFRHRVIDAGGARRRHGHMPGVTVAMMQQSMRTDYEEVRAISTRLCERLSGDVTLTVRAPRGTDLVVRCTTSHRWHAEDGVLRDPGWTNLPGGEVLSSPASVDGVLVPDAGAWDARCHPVENADRLRIHFDRGSVASIEGGPGTEPQALLEQLDAHQARRAGQVALGTNLGVIAAIGNLLQDVKMPGFHLTLGHTRPEHTLAPPGSDVEVPLLVRRADVDVDGTPILRNGRYVAPWV